MNEEPLFTIVVPACNVAAYIGDCLRSLRAQTYTAFEVLIVSEDSQDDTRKIIAEEIAGDERFRLVEQRKTGSCSASNNYGIQNGRGKYLVFVDGDDWIERESLERFQQALEDSGEVDILLANARYYLEEDGTLQELAGWRHQMPLQRVISGPEMLALQLRNEFNTATWLKIYRRKFLQDKQLYQVNGRRHQDDEWAYRVFLAAEKTYAIDFCYYNYRKRPDSVTTTASEETFRDFTDNMIAFFRYWQANSVPEPLQGLLASWFIGQMFRFFIPHFCQNYSRSFRYQEFSRLMRDNLGGYGVYRQLAKKADRRSLRVLRPVIFLARWRCLFPLADLLYGRIWWSLMLARKKQKAALSD